MKPYYEDSAVTLYLGDCLEVMASLPMVDHVITDPPYECAIWGRTRPGKKANSRELASLSKLADGAIGSIKPRAVAGELARICRRWAIIFFDAESVAGWSAALVEHGMEHVRMGAWVKTNPMPHFSGDRPSAGYEAAAICHQPGRKRWNGSGAAVWTFPTCMGEDRPNHPCPKPLELMADIVSDFTDPGEVILDPFMGSGTTLRAAKDLGRKAIGIEINEKYCEVAAKRMEQEVLFAAPKAEPEQMEMG